MSLEPINIATLTSSSQKNTTDFNQTLPLHIANLICVRAGKAMPFTREEMSAIDKAPINTPVAVNFMGLTTDEQADRKHHGGPLKAVHQLAPATYEKINARVQPKSPRWYAGRKPHD